MAASDAGVERSGVTKLVSSLGLSVEVDVGGVAGGQTGSEPRTGGGVIGLGLGSGGRAGELLAGGGVGVSVSSGIAGGVVGTVELDELLWPRADQGASLGLAVTADWFNGLTGGVGSGAGVAVPKGEAGALALSVRSAGIGGVRPEVGVLVGAASVTSQGNGS